MPFMPWIDTVHAVNSSLAELAAVGVDRHPSADLDCTVFAATWAQYSAAPFGLVSILPAGHPHGDLYRAGTVDTR
jgi:hypothetical protein